MSQKSLRKSESANFDPEEYERGKLAALLESAREDRAKAE